MVAAGIPLPRDDHAEAIAATALAMVPEVRRCSAETGLPLEVRIGIDTGPVVAGVIGRAKFSYDLWGDRVNTASRMESHAQPGTIQVAERTNERLRHRYELRQRGMVEVKGKAPMTSYLLLVRAPIPQPPPVAILTSAGPSCIHRSSITSAGPRRPRRPIEGSASFELRPRPGEAGRDASWGPSHESDGLHGK
jgi:hypothetical protein